MGKKVSIKMSTGEVLSVEMKLELPNEEIFSELLNGKKEFALVGGAAIAKEHIVFVMVEEEKNGVEEKQSSECAGNECSDRAAEPANHSGEQNCGAGSDPSACSSNL